MDTLGEIMMWTFWAGSAVIITIDIILAIRKRKTFTRRARDFGMNVPTVAYAVGLLPFHIWYSIPLVPFWGGVVFILGGAAGIVAYEMKRGKPMHPIVAFLIGLPMGALFFPG